MTRIVIGIDKSALIKKMAALSSCSAKGLAALNGATLKGPFSALSTKCFAEYARTQNIRENTNIGNMLKKNSIEICLFVHSELSAVQRLFRGTARELGRRVLAAPGCPQTFTSGGDIFGTGFVAGHSLVISGETQTRHVLRPQASPMPATCTRVCT